MTTEAPGLPYALPEGWSLEPAKREPAWRIALWTAGYVFGTWRAFVHLQDGSLGWGLGMLVFFGFIGVVAVGEFWLAGGERGRPEFVNAVALTRARVRPADSWVHLFRDAKTPVIVLVGLFILSAVSLTGSILATTAALAQDAAGWLFLSIPTIVVAAAGLLGASIVLLIRVRVGSFGRRPTGVALGRSGITTYLLDDPDEIAWERVRLVSPTLVLANEQSGDFIPWIHLETDGDIIPLPVGGMDAHAFLIYTAIRFWVDHPELRDELSTTFGQRRMLDWHAAMHGRTSEAV